MNSTAIKSLFNSIVNDIEGDWILIGGSLLNILDISNRTTLDIDLVPLHKTSNETQIYLMDIAVKNGFPPEVINFSAEYFLKKINGWENELIILNKGTKGNIFRPTKKLFRQLKENRGTETDYEDIKIYDKYFKDEK